MILIHMYGGCIDNVSVTDEDTSNVVVVYYGEEYACEEDLWRDKDGELVIIDGWKLQPMDPAFVKDVKRMLELPPLSEEELEKEM